MKAAWALLEGGAPATVRMSDIAKKVGLSRQAVYLHFPTRADLLIATARYVDEVKGIDERLAASRAASTGESRLKAFIEAWGDYIPEIYGIGKALLASRDTDEAAAAAWDDRMKAVRHGCESVVKALREDGALSSKLSPSQAVDVFWTMMSVRNWEQLTGECGWSQKQYISTMKILAARILIKDNYPPAEES